jgi:hypothetical protein
MSVDDGLCPICKQPMEAYYNYYAHHPFIDGKKYDGICQVCAEVVVWGEWKNGQFVLHEEPHLHTSEAMIKDESAGYDPKVVEVCVKALRAAVKKRLKRSPIMVKWSPRPEPEPKEVSTPKPILKSEPPKPKYVPYYPPTKHKITFKKI